MEKKEYEVLYNLEDNCWWYIGLRKLVFSLIDNFRHNNDNLSILDAGCGTGAVLEKCNIHSSYGLEISEEALKFCKLRKLNNLIRGTVCGTPFKDNSFDVVISLDTLYHAWIENDLNTLEEFYRVLNKEGMLILNLPAYNFLRSGHDKAIHTRHRYTINDLTLKIKKAGFEIEMITYRNTILFPLVAVKRMTEKFFFINKGTVESDLKQLPDMINNLFTRILNLENILINAGLKFPYGLSVFCLARKR